MPILDKENYDVLLFDCYGTLVDWESGLLDYVQPLLLSHDVHVIDQGVLEYFSEWEPLEQTRGGNYRDVLARVLKCYGNRLGFSPSQAEIDGFVMCIAKATPFADTHESLLRLGKEFQLAIGSNTDDDLIAVTIQNLKVNFAKVVTAQQAGGYKPHDSMMDKIYQSLKEVGRILHVAQSLFHDIAPATARGIDTVWIKRSRATGGAVREAEVKPTWTFEDLTSFTDAITTG